jgi:hypothetical protein
MDQNIDKYENAGVLQESLLSVTEYLPRMLQAIEEMIGDFRSSDEGKGIGLFLQAIDGLSWIHDISKGQQDYLEQVAGEMKGLQVHEYQVLLKQLLEALGEKDYVLLADLLEYEITPWLEKYLDYSMELLEELGENDWIRERKPTAN